MGLDLTSHEHATLYTDPTPHAPDSAAYWDHLYENDIYPVHAPSVFARALDGMPGQAKHYDWQSVGGDLYKLTGKRVHTYCTYRGWRHFREYLASFTRAGSMGNIVAAPERFSDVPFFDLIFFSDCEGVMGPVASRRVADAFNAHTCESSEWSRLYESVKDVFNNAADTGVVRFS